MVDSEDLSHLQNTEHTYNSHRTPANSRYRIDIKSGSGGSRAAGFSIYKRWKAQGPAVAWLSKQFHSGNQGREATTSQSHSLLLATSPSSNTSGDKTYAEEGAVWRNDGFRAGQRNASY